MAALRVVAAATAVEAVEALAAVGPRAVAVEAAAAARENVPSRT